MDWKQDVHGLFVVIEGIDACGKETQSKILHKKFQERSNPEAVLLDFPNYKGVYGELIRGHLRKEWRVERRIALVDSNAEGALRELMNAQVFQALHSADKLIAAPFIRSNTVRGIPTVANRWWPSAFSYGKGDGLDGKWLLDQNLFLPRGDLNLLVDVNVKDSFDRRPNNRDRNEERGDYLAKVRENYLGLWEEMQELPQDDQDPSAWVVVNGRGSIEETAKQIEDAVERRVELLKGGKGS